MVADPSAEPSDSPGEPQERPAEPFLTERRALGLVGAALLATAAYWLVTVGFGNTIELLQILVFFVIFALVFTGLNYAVHRYD